MENNQFYENELHTLTAAEDCTQLEVIPNHSYEHVDWQGSPTVVHQLPSPVSERQKPAPQDKEHSRSHTALVSVVLLTVVLTLSLLFVIIVLISVQISADKYQQEFQLLAEEMYQVKRIVQNSAAISTYNQAALEEQLAEVLGYISPEGFFYNPVTSCADITTSTSDYYWIRNRTNPTPAQVFCDFNRNCSCNQTGGAWMRVAKLNMTDPSQQCPEGFLLDNTVAPLRLCTRNVTPGCTSLLFDTFDIDYTHVCGRATGYQKGSTDAFDARVDADPIRSLDEIYVDGISLTHGSFPRQHIWTFAAARDETIPSCACTRPDVNYTGLITPQVKEDYFCETGSRNIFEFSRLYVEDPLWDGQGCGDGTTCCSFNNPPWFCRELPQSTTDTVEFRVCTDESSAVDEDILLEAFEIYVS